MRSQLDAGLSSSGSFLTGICVIFSLIRKDAGWIVAPVGQSLLAVRIDRRRGHLFSKNDADALKSYPPARAVDI
jgi:hypothetical protein